MDAVSAKPEKLVADEMEIHSMIRKNVNSLNPMHHHIVEGISIFTCCMNRNDNLSRSLETWLAAPEVDEILILDWSSDESVFELTKKYGSRKIVVARVEGQKQWILSYAFNLAARLTTRSKLLKLDSDVQISKDFFRYHVLEPGIFFAGNWRTAKTENEKHLNGIVYLCREDFFRVNGYNEYIKTYGWDDSDLYSRLKDSGLNRFDLLLDKMHHQEHEARMKYQASFFGDTLIEPSPLLNFEIQRNKYICHGLPAWDSRIEMLEFTITASETDNLIHCALKSPADPLRFQPCQELIEQSEVSALQEVLGWEFEKEFLANFSKTNLTKLFKIFYSCKSSPGEDFSFSPGWKIVICFELLSNLEIILSCLEAINYCYLNISIDEIHVFFKSSSDQTIDNFVCRYLNKKNIKLHFVQSIPNLQALIEYSNSHFPQSSKIACYPGCFYVDAALAQLNSIDLENVLLLSIPQCIQGNIEQGEQDEIPRVWLFQSPLSLDALSEISWELEHSAHADKLLTRTFKRNKLRLYNVSPEVRSYCCKSNPRSNSDSLLLVGKAVEPILLEDFEKDRKKCKLLTSLYNEADLERIQEYIVCLEKNLNHPLIDEIHIFYDTCRDDLDSKSNNQIFNYLQGLTTSGTHSSRIFVNCIKGRPSYRQFFEYANTFFPANSKVVIANADIYFNETLQLVCDSELKNQFLVLSRWDVLADGSLKLFYQDNNLPNYLTADAWIFQAPIEIDFYCEYQLGTWFCDSFLNTQLLTSSNLQVYNPCLDVQICHLHLARKNSEEYQERVNNQTQYWQYEFDRNHQREPNSGIVWCKLSQLMNGAIPRFHWLPRNLVVKLSNSDLDETSRLKSIISGMLIAEQTSSNFWLADSLLTNQEKGFLNFLNNSRYNLALNYQPSSNTQILSDLSSLQPNLFGLGNDICVQIEHYSSNQLFNLEAVVERLRQYDEYLAECGEALEPEDFRQWVSIACRYYHAGNYFKMRTCLEKASKLTSASSIKLFQQWIELFADFSSQFDRLFNALWLTSLPEWNSLLSLFVLKFQRPSITLYGKVFDNPEFLKHQTMKMLNKKHTLVRYSNPKVSLITSIFRGDQYIEHFLEDIVRQTAFDQCELILINPNSPGNEELIIKKYLREYPNIIYKRLTYDPGLYEVWNMGILMSRGDYINNANIDDRRAPDHLEKHIAALDTHPDIDVVSAAIKATRTPNETWENNTAYETWFTEYPSFYEAKDLFTYEFINGKSTSKIISQNIAHCMPVWRKNIHSKFGFFDEAAYGTSCDWEFWLRCAVGGTKFMLINQPLVLYYENPTSHNRRFSNKDVLEAKIVQRYCLPILADSTNIHPHFYETNLLKFFVGSTGTGS